MRINSDNLCKALHTVPDTWNSLNISFIFGNLFQVLGSTVSKQDLVEATSCWESQEEGIKKKKNDIDELSPTLELHVLPSSFDFF